MNTDASGELEAELLFAWECGGGMGHIRRIAPVAKRLAAAGHKLTLAVRDISKIDGLIDDHRIRWMQAPTRVCRPLPQYPHTMSLPQIFCNVGYADRRYLAGIVDCWTTVLELIRPRLVIADHSLGCMLACRVTGTPYALIGTGFTCPSVGVPMPSLGEATSPQAEEDLVRTMNEVLCDNRAVPVDALATLYCAAVETFICTFKPLDPYPVREADYFGAWPATGVSAPEFEWPRGAGSKIFAYLKPSRGLGLLLDWLKKSDHPSVIVGDGLDVAALRSIASPNLLFPSSPVSIEQASSECDLSILNGTHGSTCSMLLAGKPMLHIPHNLEQSLTASRSVELGAARVAARDDGHAIIAELNKLLEDHDAHRSSALQFRDRYVSYRPETAITEITARIIAKSNLG